jgi:hypothetical protein
MLWLGNVDGKSNWGRECPSPPPCLGGPKPKTRSSFNKQGLQREGQVGFAYRVETWGKFAVLEMRLTVIWHAKFHGDASKSLEVARLTMVFLPPSQSVSALKG